MLKKFIVVLLMVCLLGGMLTGCKKDDNVERDKTEEVSTDTSQTTDQTTDQMTDQTTSQTSSYQVTEEGLEVVSINAPISSYWFPGELLEWDPSKDEDAKYNKSTVPLAERMKKEDLITINETQNKDTKLVALSIMNSSTSGNPSHGYTSFDTNTFSYWQYIDMLVYWGGSSGEGIIVPPSADVTDSAHRNGVPVLGTVFFPQVAHGGKMEWLDLALTKDGNGDFPFAKKLVEVAETYGFDGWFMNQETEGTEEEPLTSEHSVLMQEFIMKYKEYSSNGLEIMWYDSQTIEGEMDWQNTLNEKNEMFLIQGDKPVADSMFLNFWWYYRAYFEEELIEKAAAHAESINIDPYELYAGIDVQANGSDQPVRWNLLEQSMNKTFTSIGLYCPSWTFFSSSSIDEFQEKENRFWINEFGDPRDKTKAVDMEWRGISTYITERSAVTKMPFYTDFNMGNGYNYFINGEKVSKLDWNNRSLADVMPTYRWIVDNEGNNKVIPSIDFANAYNGGSSLRFLSDMEALSSSTITLFRSDLTLTENTVFDMAGRADKEIAMDLVLGFSDNTETVIKGSQTLMDEWNEINYDIKEHVGKTIRTIGVKLTSEEAVDKVFVNLGSIAVYENKEEVINVNNLNVDDSAFEEEGTIAGVRLSWDAQSQDSVKTYEVYQVNEDGSLSFLGANRNNCFFVNALVREKGIDKTNFMVFAVNWDNERGSGASVEMTWPDNTVPKARFVAEKTIAAPMEEVSFINKSNAVTESVRWEFPGASPETSTEDNPRVIYEQEGFYTVTLFAINEKGEDKVVGEELIYITEAAKDGLTKLSENKPVEASSYVNDAEAPQFAVDGVINTKWCAVGPDQHNITIDLEEVINIGEVKISHAEAGGESDGMNTEEYRIEVSEDGQAFETVAEVIKSSASETVDAFKMTKARYVRLTILKATQGSDSAARIYEVEVYGLNE